jgi:hypothetical protein
MLEQEGRVERPQVRQQRTMDHALRAGSPGFDLLPVRAVNSAT